MWPQAAGMLLQYGLPAAVGGWSAASKAREQGQGPLQQALASLAGAGLGVGLSYGGGKVARMAGSKLLGVPTGTAAGLASPAMAQKMQLSNLIGGIGAQVAPLAAAPIAAGATGLAGSAVPATAAGAASYGTATNQPQGPLTGYDPMPYDVRSNPLLRPETVTDKLTGPEAAARLGADLWFRQGLQQSSEASRLAQAFTTQAQKDAMARQLAAAQIRSNIALNAESTLRGISNAQQMGRDSQQQIAAALIQPYNFG